MPPVERILPDQFDPDPALQTVLDRLTTYYPRAIDPGLERTFRLLEDLGSPHLSIPPAIHVGGTNGKGSTVAYLRAIIESSGHSCHVMTSPHLVRFNERIVISGKEISSTNLIELLEEVEDVNNGRATTSFEIITAAGFLAFSRKPANFSLLEVGLGGRLDATNVIPKPLASAITVISRDHTKFLGDHLAQIAHEKAGIIKRNCPAIIGPQTTEGLRDGVMSVFERNAALMNAPLYRHGYEWSYDVLPNSLILHTSQNAYELPHPNLRGDHQYGNAATAAMTILTALDHSTINIPLSAIETGLTKARWPGRLQLIQKGPLRHSLSDIWELWIDGGHNDTGGQVLGVEAKHWREHDNKPLHIILGMLNTKSPLDFAIPLSPYAASIQTITIPDQPLSFTHTELKDILASSLPTQVTAADSVMEAVRHIQDNYPQGGRILITGSLYLMGHILSLHE